MIVLPVFPVLLVVPMWHLRIRYRRMLVQQGMLRRCEMSEMMNLMRYGAAGGAGVVTMHDGQRMALVRRLLTMRQLTARARYFRPPDPRGSQDAGAEGHH